MEASVEAIEVSAALLWKLGAASTKWGLVVEASAGGKAGGKKLHFH